MSRTTIDGAGAGLGVGDRRARLLVVALAVDDDGVVLLPDLLAPLPDLLHERARRVVRLRRDAARGEGGLDLSRGPEGGDDHEVVGAERLEGDELLAGRRAEEADAARLEVVVDVGVVDHLREEEDPSGGRLLRVLVERAVGDLDGVLDAVAEAEVAGDLEPHGAEVEHAGAEVALARIGRPSRLFDDGDDRALVEGGDVELAHGDSGG